MRGRKNESEGQRRGERVLVIEGEKTSKCETSEREKRASVKERELGKEKTKAERQRVQ